MKKFITYTMVAACGLIAWGCEDFLNEQPQSDFTRPQTEGGVLVSAYETVQDAQNELNGAYASFKTDLYELSNFLIGDVMSDNCYVGGDGINEEQFDLMTVTPTNSVIDLSWSQYYTLAGSATSVIENIRLMPEGQDYSGSEIHKGVGIFRHCPALGRCADDSRTHSFHHCRKSRQMVSGDVSGKDSGR